MTLAEGPEAEHSHTALRITLNGWVFCLQILTFLPPLQFLTGGTHCHAHRGLMTRLCPSAPGGRVITSLAYGMCCDKSLGGQVT